jgi:hypothetical protein
LLNPTVFLPAANRGVTYSLFYVSLSPSHHIFKRNRTSTSCLALLCIATLRLALPQRNPIWNHPNQAKCLNTHP